MSRGDRTFLHHELPLAGQHTAKMKAGGHSELFYSSFFKCVLAFVSAVHIPLSSFWQAYKPEGNTCSNASTRISDSSAAEHVSDLILVEQKLGEVRLLRTIYFHFAFAVVLQ